MLLGVDHLVIAVSDPDDAVTRLSSMLGVEPGGGGRHDLFGTFNRLIWLGDSFIELIGVFDRSTARSSWLGAPTIRALDDGGGLATWAVATDDIWRDVERLRAGGARLDDPVAGARRRPDGSTVRWWFSLPPRLGPREPPFLIEHDTAAAEWSPADRAERAAGPARLRALDLTVRDIGRAADGYARTLGLGRDQTSDASGDMGARIGPHLIRLHEGEVQASIPTIGIVIDRAVDRSFELFGCRWAVNG